MTSTCGFVSPASHCPSWTTQNEAKFSSQTPIQYASARHTNTRNTRYCCTESISLPFWEQFCRHTSITCKRYLFRCVEEWKHSSIHSWARHLMGSKWRASSPGHFTPQERASEALWLGIWLRSRTSTGEVMVTIRVSSWQESHPDSPVSRPQPSLMPIGSHCLFSIWS